MRCLACNKTYMGELGEMGRVQIPRPRGDKLPFTCFITFSSPPSTRIQVYYTKRKYPFPLLLVLEYIYIRPRGDILHIPDILGYR